MLDVCSSAQPSTISGRCSFGAAVITSHKRAYFSTHYGATFISMVSDWPFLSVRTKLIFPRIAVLPMEMLCFVPPRARRGGRRGKPQSWPSHSPVPASVHTLVNYLQSGVQLRIRRPPLTTVGDLVYACSSSLPPAPRPPTYRIYISMRSLSGLLFTRYISPHSTVVPCPSCFLQPFISDYHRSGRPLLCISPVTTCVPLVCPPPIYSATFASKAPAADRCVAPPILRECSAYSLRLHSRQ